MMSKTLIKSIVAALIVLTLETSVSARMDLLLDRDARENVQGFPFKDWFASFGSSGNSPCFRFGMQVSSPATDADRYEFILKSASVVDWEIRKNLKRKCFQLGFLPAKNDLLLSYQIIQYCSRKSFAGDAEMAILFYLASLLPSGEFRQEQVMPVLMNCGETGKKIVKEKLPTFPSFGFRPAPSPAAVIQAESPMLTAEEYRSSQYEKAYAMALQHPGPSVLSLLNFYPAKKIVDDMVVRKAVTARTVVMFCAYAVKLPVVSDSVVREILKYTDHPTVINYLILLLGRNPLIDQFMRAQVDRIFTADWQRNRPGEYFYLTNKSVAELSKFLAGRSFNDPRIDIVGMVARYATLTGKDDEIIDMFRQLYLDYKKAHADQENMLFYTPDRIWEWAYGLLLQPSRMSLANRRFLVERFLHYPGYSLSVMMGSNPPVTVSPQNAAVLIEQDLSNVKTRRTALWLAERVPFADLSEPCRRILFKYYLEQMSSTSRQEQRMRIVAKLLEIDDSAYRREFFEVLFQNIKRAGGMDACPELEIIRIGGSAFIPYLLEAVRREDPLYGTIACRLIGDAGRYASQYVPELISLVNDSSVDFSVQIAAMAALAEIGSEEAIPTLEKKVGVRNKMVSRAATQALLMLRKIDSLEAVPKTLLKPEIKQRMERMEQMRR